MVADDVVDDVAAAGGVVGGLDGAVAVGDAVVVEAEVVVGIEVACIVYAAPLAQEQAQASFVDVGVAAVEGAVVVVHVAEVEALEEVRRQVLIASAAEQEAELLA